jgi:hypothetical protein
LFPFGKKEANGKKKSFVSLREKVPFGEANSPSGTKKKRRGVFFFLPVFFFQSIAVGNTVLLFSCLFPFFSLSLRDKEKKVNKTKVYT